MCVCMKKDGYHWWEHCIHVIAELMEANCRPFSLEQKKKKALETKTDPPHPNKKSSHH